MDRYGTIYRMKKDRIMVTARFSSLIRVCYVVDQEILKIVRFAKIVKPIRVCLVAVYKSPRVSRITSLCLGFFLETMGIYHRSLNHFHFAKSQRNDVPETKLCSLTANFMAQSFRPVQITNVRQAENLCLAQRFKKT